MENTLAKNARISKTKVFFADGQISLSDNLKQLFELPLHNELSLNESYSGTLAIRVDQSTRDSRTNFLTSKMYNDVLATPEQSLFEMSFSSIFWNNLAVAMQWDENQGHEINLKTSFGGRLTYQQKNKKNEYQLERCCLDIREIDGSIRVIITTNIKAELPKTSDNEAQNKQVIDGDIKCEFLVDFTTRALRFGVNRSLLYKPKERQELNNTFEDITVPSLKNIKLNSLSHEQIYLDYQPSSLFGIEDDFWVKVNDDGDSNIDISYVEEARRDKNGLIDIYRQRQQPTLKFKIGTLKKLIGMVRLSQYQGKDHSRRKLTFVSDVGGWKPTAMHNREIFESRVPIDTQIKQLEVQLLLNQTGLFFSYNAHCPTYPKNIRGKATKDGWLDGTILFTWGTLIARYPEFWLRNRQDYKRRYGGLKTNFGKIRMPFGKK